MGQKYKGGMYCPQCQKPVMAVKNTHKLRNTLSIMALPATNVLSGAAIKSEGYICPNCGGPAITRRVKGGSSLGYLVNQANKALDARKQRRGS
jgi:ssDNA-binding Zn-finger/Zn-ribbon topoisomerase 1